jgi:hypothetical protein
MHGDLYLPVTPARPGGRRYFLLLIYDLSRYMWVVVHGSKGEATNAIRVFSTTTSHHTARSRMTSSSGATRRLWGWLVPSSSKGECKLSSGRGSGDGYLHPQPLAHQDSQWQDVVRGLAWVKASSLSPTGLQLPHVRQGAWPH